VRESNHPDLVPAVRAARWYDRGAVLAEERDVLVVGSGAAGLMAAIEAATIAPTMLLTDGAVGRSNTALAQGGLQIPFDSDESRQSLVRDMERSARAPVQADRVERFVAEILPTLRRLKEWGLVLDRDKRGELVRRTAGGLSEPRIVSARDQIGPALLDVLKPVLASSGADVRPGQRVVAVRPWNGGVELDVASADGRHCVRAKAVVVCTGGTSSRYAAQRNERTTNQPNDNGRLFDQLGALGLRLVEPDAYQYQPFGLVEVDGAAGRCVPESVVNFPVRLIDRRRRPIVDDIRQDRYTLTHRIFEVAAAGEAHEVSAGAGVWLTLSEADPDALAAAFPKLRRTLDRHGWVGADVVVFPFLHYYLGGFAVGRDGETQIPGLYLAGEMVGGLHGLNRLMGNGITDSLVHGRLAGRAAAQHAQES
jgi:succinate dehydrogenase/fumarate reductase flavoprotein subunit